MSDCPQTPQEGTFLKPEHIKVPVLPPNAHLDSDCRGVASILARVGDKWSVFVIMLLGNGPRRFNEIKRMVAVGCGSRWKRWANGPQIIRPRSRTRARGSIGATRRVDMASWFETRGVAALLTMRV